MLDDEPIQLTGHNGVLIIKRELAYYYICVITYNVVRRASTFALEVTLSLNIS